MLEPEERCSLGCSFNPDTMSRAGSVPESQRSSLHSLESGQDAEGVRKVQDNKPIITSPSQTGKMEELSIVDHICCPNLLKMEAGGSEVQGQLKMQKKSTVDTVH